VELETNTEKLVEAAESNEAGNPAPKSAGIPAVEPKVEPKKENTEEKKGMEFKVADTPFAGVEVKEPAKSMAEGLKPINPLEGSAEMKELVEEVGTGVEMGEIDQKEAIIVPEESGDIENADDPEVKPTGKLDVAIGIGKSGTLDTESAQTEQLEKVIEDQKSKQNLILPSSIEVFISDGKKMISNRVFGDYIPTYLIGNPDGTGKELFNLSIGAENSRLAHSVTQVRTEDTIMKEFTYKGKKYIDAVIPSRYDRHLSKSSLTVIFKEDGNQNFWDRISKVSGAVIDHL
jgi:hypothetical protein